MKVKFLEHVNSHWYDGRHFAAMPGTVTVVDDKDTDGVAQMRYLVATGAAEIVEEVTEPEQAEETDEQLRVRADELGIKVDRRWGADRLRAEIKAAEDKP